MKWAQGSDTMSHNPNSTAISGVAFHGDLTVVLGVAQGAVAVGGGVTKGRKRRTLRGNIK
jgi:hypothetical protein